MLQIFPSRILLFLFVKEIYCNLECGRCLPGDSLMCPGYQNPEIQVYINEDFDLKYTYMYLTCSDKSSIDYSLLQGCSFPSVNYLKIITCPVFNESLVNVFPDIGLRQANIKYLHIVNTHQGVSVPTQDFLDRLPNLELIHLEYTYLLDIPVGFFSQAISLKRLTIEGNSFGFLKPKLLEPLKSLETLNLIRLVLNSIENGTFDNLTNLKSLFIRQNNITSIPNSVFHRLSHLQNLTFQNNNLMDISKDAFINNQKLQLVRLNINRLSKLPASLFRNNTQLKIVEIMNNRLDELPEELFKFSPNISILNFKKNKLRELPNLIFSELEQLETLSLSGNQIRELPPDIFESNTNLKFLDLSNNELVSLSPQVFRSLKSLKALYLNLNTLTTVPEFLLINCHSLEHLNLNNNNLSQLSYKVFPRLSSTLKEIDLSHNRLSSRSVSENQIFALNALLKLEKIDFSYNNFTDFPSNSKLFNFLSLKTLNFEGNKMRWIEFSYFLDLVNGTVVNLRNNQIERVIPYTKYERKMLFMWLGGNNFTCDCLLYEFASLVQNNEADLFRLEYSIDGRHHPRDTLGPPVLVHVIDRTKLKCRKPDILTNIAIVNISLSQLSCPMLEDECSSECPCTYWPHSNLVIVDCDNLNLAKLPNIYIKENFNYQLNLQRNLISVLNFSVDDPIVKVDLRSNNISSESLSGNTTLPLTLMQLDLSDNNLTHVEEDFLTLFESRPIQWSLNDNPWVCDCAIRHFHNFLQDNFEKVSDIRNITCDDEDGRPLIDLTEGDLCPAYLKPVVLGSIGAFAASLFLIGVLGTVLYFRFKTSIKIWLYSHKLCLWFVTEEEIDADKKYDAFISYSHKDEEFINNILVPGLENGDPKYKVCLHYRDWIGGEFIPNQIVRSVEESRRTLVILSTNFIESIWAQMEFRAAHQQALQDKTNRVIVIVYGEMPSPELMDEELRHYVSLHTYLKWGDQRFWDSLRYAMPHYKHRPPSETSKKKAIKLIDKIELAGGTGSLIDVNNTNGTAIKV